MIFDYNSEDLAANQTKYAFLPAANLLRSLRTFRLASSSGVKFDGCFGRRPPMFRLVVPGKEANSKYWKEFSQHRTGLFCNIPFCPPDVTSSAAADGGDVCHDELSELDPVDPRLWSWWSWSNENDGNGATNPAWHGTDVGVSFVNSKNVCKESKKLEFFSEFFAMNKAKRFFFLFYTLTCSIFLKVVGVKVAVVRVGTPLCMPSNETSCNEIERKKKLIKFRNEQHDFV